MHFFGVCHIKNDRNGVLFTLSIFSTKMMCGTKNPAALCQVWWEQEVNSHVQHAHLVLSCMDTNTEYVCIYVDGNFKTCWSIMLWTGFQCRNPWDDREGTNDSAVLRICDEATVGKVQNTSPLTPSHKACHFNEGLPRQAVPHASLWHTPARTVNSVCHFNLTLLNCFARYFPQTDFLSDVWWAS